MSFNIEFDYRFAPAGAFDDNAKQRLEEAARIWESFIADEFPNIPAGTQIQVRNTQTGDPRTGTIETITLDREIDDLLIFVGARENLGFAGAAGPIPTSGSLFDERYYGSNFEPWTGSIVFSLEPDGSAYSDLGVNLHEIAHILGIGTAPIFRQIGEGALFDGPNALRVNGGQPIPLESDSAHIGGAIMDAYGGASLTNILELAALADIGYQIPRLQSSDPPPLIIDYRLTGTPANDRLFGSNGNDVFDGGGGDDDLGGNRGNDTLNGDSGKDALRGGQGNDTLNGGEGDDYLEGNEGDDALNGGSGKDYLRGGQGNDTLNGGDGDDNLDGDEGDDVLNSGSGNDALGGGQGNDTLNGGEGDNYLEGNEGNDILNGGGGKDYLRGGQGNDTLNGGDGDDNLEGNEGDDVLNGGSGSDALGGGQGNDVIIGTGDDYLTGGTGRDTFVFTAASSNNRIADFTVAEDFIQVSPALGFINKASVLKAVQNNYFLTLGTGQTVGISNDAPLTVNNFILKLDGDDVLVGTQKADVIDGEAGNDRITGLGGNDVLTGGAGNDLLSGGAKNDRLYGGSGNDSLLGGAGKDVFVLERGAGSDIIRDFRVGQDRLGLSQGLQFNRLGIVQKGGNTVISLGKDKLAVLAGVQASQITGNQFVGA